ncbi:MAG TPA: transposase [Candidatus Nitrosotenuis sp.]|jgi:putative transposase|nr:transposase [Candidatus Nitrosotenuis sp.]
MPALVLPGCLHVVTQRTRARQILFSDSRDYETYLSILADCCRDYRVRLEAYCLMPDHVHLIARPPSEQALPLALTRAHRRYARLVVRPPGRRVLWQGRPVFSLIDEYHLATAACHVELNPVRAGLVQRAWDWRWSSAWPHCSGQEDPLVEAEPWGRLYPRWARRLRQGLPERLHRIVSRYLREGMVLGRQEFLEQVRYQTGLRFRAPRLRPRRRDASPGLAAG